MHVADAVACLSTEGLMEFVKARLGDRSALPDLQWDIYCDMAAIGPLPRAALSATTEALERQSRHGVACMAPRRAQFLSWNLVTMVAMGSPPAWALALCLLVAAVPAPVPCEVYR